jgi:Fe-S-cluster containining protein
LALPPILPSKIRQDHVAPVDDRENSLFVVAASLKSSPHPEFPRSVLQRYRAKILVRRIPEIRRHRWTVWRDAGGLLDLGQDLRWRHLRNSEEECVFLDGNLCMIYEVRPKTCRDFPHVAIGAHSLGGRQSSHARWAALRPITFNALESYKHLTGYRPHSVVSTTSRPSVCTTTPLLGDQPPHSS